MSAFLAPILNDQFFLANGDPLAGGKIFSYVAGTTTKLALYTGPDGATPYANPLVLDAGGRIPSSGSAWLTVGSKYKFVLAPANDTDPPASPYWTVDAVAGINDNSFSTSTIIAQEWTTGTTPTFVSANTYYVAGDQRAAHSVGRRVRTVNTIGTVYGTIVTSTYTTVTTVVLALDSSALDSGLSAVDLGLLNPAAPSAPGSLLYATGSPPRNKIINSRFDIDEYRSFTAFTPVLASTTYGTNRWRTICEQSSIEFQVKTPGPTPILHYLNMLTTTAKTPTAAHQYHVAQYIEARQLEDWAFGSTQTNKFTLSFYAYASIAGAYAVAFQNAASDRSYVTTFSLPADSIWTKVQVTVPVDTAGPWLTGSNIGLKVIWDLGAGSNFLAPTLNLWQAGNYSAAAGTVRPVTTLNAILRITDVCLELGSAAVYPREKRHFSEELKLCQHYAYTINAAASSELRIGLGPALSTTTARILIEYPTMHAPPALGAISTVTDWRIVDFVGSHVVSAMTILTDTATTESAVLSITASAGSMTGFRIYTLTSQGGATARIQFEAEL